MKKNNLVNILLLTCFCCVCSVGKKNTAIISDNIVIINSGKNFRLPLAKEIAIINSLNPRVITLDLELTRDGDFFGDSVLQTTLNQCKNLVMACEIANYTGNDGEYSDLTGTHPDFLRNAKIGYTNVTVENDSFQTLKKFSVFEKVRGLTVFQLAVRTAMEFDSLKTVSFLKNNPRKIDVRYRGNEQAFKVFSYEDVFQGKLKRSDVEGKIVLVGFLELYKGYKGTYDEDKFFSPLNNMKKPYKPDMHGVVYLANIVVQVLEDIP